jgi:hypothetical protein
MTGTAAVSHPSLAMPAYDGSNPAGTYTVDPVYKTKLVRVTGDPGTAIAGISGKTWLSVAGSEYPKTPAWNADGSMLVMYGASSGFLIVDGNTYKPLVFRGGVPGYTVPDFRWHPTNPKVFVVVDDSGKVGQYDPIANTVSWSYDPGAGLYTGGSIGFSEGNVSNDGTKVVVSAYRVSDGKPVFYAVDLTVRARVSPVISIDDLGFSALDWASISSRGTYIVASNDWTKQKVIRLDGSCATTFSSSCVVSSWANMGHYDLGLLADGTTEVAFNSGEPSYVRLSDPSGARVSLTGPSVGDYYHSSTRNILAPGWGFASMDWAGGNLNGEVYAIELRNGGQVKRFGYSYRSSTTAYDHQTDAVPSPDGMRIFFRSDWGNSSGPVYGFIADARTLCGN